jgi:nicotinamidase-related amidase
MRGKIRWESPNGNRYIIPELKIEGRNSAFLILDLQLAYAHPDYGLGRRLRGFEPLRHEYFYRRLAETVIPNVLKLQAFFRTHRLPVIYTRMGLQLPNGKDLPPWSWRNAQASATSSTGTRTLYPVDAPEYNLLPEISPQSSELIVDKHSLSPFNSTPLDQWLRNMKVENLVVCGIITDAAVEHTARNAGDRGYNVIVIEDACAALSKDEHEESFLYGGWFVAKSATQLMDELSPLIQSE